MSDDSVNLEQLEGMIESALEEASVDPKNDGVRKPKGYSHSPDLDLMGNPQGDRNRLKRQGAANFGPYTAEQVLRAFVGKKDAG